VSTPRLGRSQDADGRLTGLLARWADAHRLTERQATAIFRQIVGESAPPDFDWWWQLLDPESGTAFRGLRRSSDRGIDAPAVVPPVAPRTVWAPTQTGSAAWAQDADDYQPYLRLT